MWVGSSSSSAQVRLGTVKATGKQYAVKIIHKKFIMEKKNKDIVFRERQILNALKHPFVVTLHYTFQTQTDLCTRPHSFLVSLSSFAEMASAKQRSDSPSSVELTSLLCSAALSHVCCR